MFEKFMFRILALSIVIFVSCESQEPYIYENIRPEIASYLNKQPFNDFAQSDTLIIYDTTYFNNMITALSKYQDKLIVEDSMYNRQITERLALIKIKKIQSKQPDIYLPFQAIQDNLTKENSDKIMVWLTSVPKQFEAAKMQLKTPDLRHTQKAIEDLKSAYSFVSEDLKTHLQTSNQSEKYQQVINNIILAIKDYMAFLNSKILNKEVS